MDNNLDRIELLLGVIKVTDPNINEYTYDDIKSILLNKYGLKSTIGQIKLIYEPPLLNKTIMIIPEIVEEDLLEEYDDILEEDYLIGDEDELYEDWDLKEEDF